MKTIEFIKLISNYITGKEPVFPDTEISRITVDSREVGKGAVFFCIKGERSDGHDFIKAAFDRGAVIVAGEQPLVIDNYVCLKSVPDTLKAISAQFYGNPQKKLKMVGITGTNGKTTTSYMIENGLKDIGRTAVIGTLGYKIPGAVISAPNTTPFIWKWYELLAEMVSCNVENVVAEVSSHGLDQGRVEGTQFEVAVFTNLSRDHLDYHHNIDSYFNAKKKLFTHHLKKDGLAVINIDNFYGRKLYDELPADICRKSISLENSSADLYVQIKKEGNRGTDVIFNFSNKKIEKTVPMIGRFNVYNTACAILSCEPYLGFDESVNKVCGKIVVPGRMEMVGEKAIYIDYAHTPDALSNILKAAKEVSDKGRVIVLFGAGGDRDKGKRPEMGKVVSMMADIAIITDDNPRTENPDEIIEQIKEGCINSKCEIEVIRDRKSAIRRGIDIMSGNDILIIAGKGAENYQITGTEKRYFSDREEVETYLEELKNV